jgi:ATP phosphoribosyltransferase regulatory subunit
MSENHWLLPEGIEELLPEAAKRIERVRHDLLNLYRAWGYELVMPPFIEYLESLLTGTGNDLDLQTFKLTDQLSGRTMGLRADMTPQVARIDAHVLNRNAPTRLCYIGTVLRTRPLELGGSRSPIQVGAELYGHEGPESDVEIMRLMLASLATVGINDVLLDLGHVGIFRGLAQDAGLDATQEAKLFDILQRKSVPELESFLTDFEADEAAKSRLALLSELSGGYEVLSVAQDRLEGAGTGVLQSLQALRRVADLLHEQMPALTIHYDLAELRGYNYHTGVVFAAYSIGLGKAIAQGGRYDNMGIGDTLSRPATGFSADVNKWVSLSGISTSAYAPGILAPYNTESSLLEKIEQLRQSGERVIQELPDVEGNQTSGCDRRLTRKDDHWQVEPIE